MTLIQGVTRHALQLQKLFSTKGPEPLTAIGSAIQAVHPIVDVNAPELQAIKGHLPFTRMDYRGSNLTGTTGNFWQIGQPANSGRMTVITALTVDMDVTSTAADEVGVWLYPIQQGAMSGTSDGVAPADSRISLIGLSTQLWWTTLAAGGLPNVSTNIAGVVRVMPAAAQVVFRVPLVGPGLNAMPGLTIFPGSFVPVYVQKNTSTFLGFSYAVLNVSGYERTFEPSELVPGQI